MGHILKLYPFRAICEEERQRRHQAGNFTPSQKTATPVRNKCTLPQTKRWEDKLDFIIGTTAATSPSQNCDPEIVDFLLGLDMTQPSSQSPSSKPPSQRSFKLSQMNLSVRGKDEDGVSSDDDNEMSIMMTQKIFYDTDNNHEVKDEKSDHPVIIQQSPDIVRSPDIQQSPDILKSPEKEKVVQSSGTSDDFDDITDSQLLQLDGNCDGEDEKVVRKRKRLGGRPSQSVMLPLSGSSSVTPARVLRSSNTIGKELFQSKKSTKVCSRPPESTAASAQEKKPSGKRKAVKIRPPTPDLETFVPSSLHSPKGITKVDLTIYR